MIQCVRQQARIWGGRGRGRGHEIRSLHGRNFLLLKGRGGWVKILALTKFSNSPPKTMNGALLSKYFDAHVFCIDFCRKF